MPKPEFIARQSAHPTGWLGHVVARVMAVHTAAANRRVIARLEPKPGENVLEIGCGHGRMLREIARRVAPGLAAGVDPSDVMRSVARRTLRREIDAGHASVAEGSADEVPFPDARFDKVVSVHTIYFWPDLAAGLRELRRVLREGGELLLAFHDGSHPQKAEALPATVYTLHRAEAVADALEAAGFHEIVCEIDPDTHLCYARARR
ncbi:MAG: methyltransferase domain-containing protein [Myxococcales bacterium]|nr:methyltransferase domain-containing protein [Myxococcales bacterium]